MVRAGAQHGQLSGIRSEDGEEATDSGGFSLALRSGVAGLEPERVSRGPQRINLNVAPKL